VGDTEVVQEPFAVPDRSGLGDGVTSVGEAGVDGRFLAFAQLIELPVFKAL